jgi:two-component system chemotaxis response regulator CheY
MKSINVIVVDDNRATLKLTELTLKSMGFENIKTALNGQEGFDKISSEKTDLILSDWNMPIMDGMKLLEKLKADEKLKEIPFIMQTSQRSQEHILEALQKGVDSYIVKPYESSVLKEKIKDVLNKKN